MRFRNRFLVSLFLAVLACPSLATLLRVNPMQALDEKRALATEPALASLHWRESQSVADFARRWESYYGDHFGLRKLLVGGYRLASFHLLRTSLNPAVIVGHTDGRARWLYYEASAAGGGMGFDGFLGRRPYAQAELAAIALNLAQQAQLLADRQVKFLYITVPDKQTIYPEYLPRELRPGPGVRSRLDQLAEVTQQVLGSAYLDLRQTMLQAKSHDLMYFPHDTHWTPAAAFLAYSKVMAAMQVQDPTRTPLPQQAFRLEPSPIYSIGDLSDLAGLPPISKHPLAMPVLAAPLPPGHQRGKLLMYCDSYFREFLKLYLEAEFAQVKIVYGAYKAGTPIVSPAALEVEKPDMVIVESAERFWTW